MDRMWKNVCKVLWVSCGKTVEKLVEKRRFSNFVVFGCGKVSLTANKISACVGKVVCFSGKAYKMKKGREFAVSTVST